MISRPPFIVVLLSFLSLLVVLAILILPSPESVWEEIEPTSFAKTAIRNSAYYSGPLISDIGSIEQPLRGWRHLVARSDANQVFREIAREATTAGRLWALSALTLTDSTEAARLYAELSADTTSVVFIPGCEALVDVPAATLAKRAVDRAWVGILRDSLPTCGLWRWPSAS